MRVHTVLSNVSWERKMKTVKLFVVVGLACLTQACVGGSSGAYTSADQVGRYTSEVLENEYIKQIVARTSCDGAGLHTASSQIETYEVSRRGASIRTRQNAECTKFDGQIIPPRGMTRPQVGGSQHAQ